MIQNQLQHAMETIESLKDKEIIDDFAYMCMMNGIKKVYEAENEQTDSEEDSEYEPSFIDDESIDDTGSESTGEANVTVAIIMQALQTRDKIALWLNGFCFGLMFSALTRLVY